MPMKNASKKSYKKKSVTVYKRKSFPWRSRAIATPPVTGLGMSTTTVLRTSFFANVSAIVGTGIYNGYLKPGSCFDPTGDVATIQPQLFDQFAAIYNRYQVNSCKIRMKITGNVAANGVGVWVGAAYPAIDSTALTTYQAAASQQYAKTTSGGFNLVQAVGVGVEGKYLSFDLNHKAVLGDRTYSFDTGALVTADPTTLQYMLLPIFLQGSAAGVSTWVLEVDMWQNVTFSQKKNTVDA